MIRFMLAVLCLSSSLFAASVVVVAGDGQVATDCFMTSGSAVLNCASNHFAASDVGKVIAAYENGPTTSGYVQPLSTTILSFQSATQVTLNASASNTTTSTISTLSSCARALNVVTCNTTAAHNLSVGQMVTTSFNPASGSADTTIIGTFLVQSVPSGTSFTFKQWQMLDNASISPLTAVSATGYSSRVIWGTDRTAALQNAADTCGDFGGCTLVIPKGLYLTHGINLSCSKLGNFTVGGSGICNHVHNNVQIQGDGIDLTILENWDIATSANTVTGNIALIAVGGQADQYPYRSTSGGPLRPITGISLNGLTLRQVKNATNGIKGFWADNAGLSDGTQGYEISEVKVISWSYEGFYAGGIHYYVHNSQAMQSGLTGPANATTNAAFNMIGAWGRVDGCYVTDSGQAFESGNPHQFMRGNVADGLGNDINSGVSPHLLLNVTSNTYGTWDVHFDFNKAQGWSGESFDNVLGIFKDSTFNYNNLVDDVGGLNLGTGKETNNVNIWPDLGSSPHGTSIVAGNRWLFTKNGRPVTYVFGVNSSTQTYSLENWRIEDNTVTYTTPFCSTSPFQPTFDSATCNAAGSATIGAGLFSIVIKLDPPWTASATIAANSWIVPFPQNGFIYFSSGGGTTGTSQPTWCTTTGCTVLDNAGGGTVTWTLYSLAPTISITNLKVSAPLGALPFGTIGQEYNIPFNLGSRSAVIFTNDTYNLATRMMLPNATATANIAQTIPAGGVFNDAGSGGICLLPTTKFANLPAAPDGCIVPCPDCNTGCTAGGGTGQTCFRENGAWGH